MDAFRATAAACLLALLLAQPVAGEVSHGWQPPIVGGWSGMPQMQCTLVFFEAEASRCRFQAKTHDARLLVVRVAGAAAVDAYVRDLDVEPTRQIAHLPCEAAGARVCAAPFLASRLNATLDLLVVAHARLPGTVVTAHVESPNALLP